MSLGAVELTGNAAVCSSEAAVFTCSRNEVPLITWEVQSTCGSNNVDIGFSSSSNPVELAANRTLCDSILTFTTTSATASFISNLISHLRLMTITL